MESSVRSQGVILSLEAHTQALVEYSPAKGTSSETKQVPFTKFFYGELPAPAHLIKEGTTVEVETINNIVVRVVLKEPSEVLEDLGTIVDSNTRITSISYSQGSAVEEVDTSLIRGTDGKPVAGGPELKKKLVKVLVANHKIVSATLVAAASEVVEGQRYTLEVVPHSQKKLEGVVSRLTSRFNVVVTQDGVKTKYRVRYSEVTYVSGRTVDQNDLIKGEKCHVLLDGDQPRAQLLRNRRYCQSLADIEGIPEAVGRNFYSLFLNRELPVVFYYAVLETVIRLNCNELVDRIVNYTTDPTLRSMAYTAARLASEEYFCWQDLEEEVLTHAQHIINVFAKQLKRSQSRQVLANALHIAVELIDMASLGSLMYVPTSPEPGPIPLIRIIETSGFNYIMYVPQMLDLDGIHPKTLLPERPRTQPAIEYPFYYAPPQPGSPPAVRLPPASPVVNSPPVEVQLNALCCHGQPARVCINRCFSCVKCFSRLLTESQCWCGVPLDLANVDWAGFRAPCDACKTVVLGTQAAALDCGCFMCATCYLGATENCLYCLSPISARTRAVNQRLS